MSERTEPRIPRPTPEDLALDLAQSYELAAKDPYRDSVICKPLIRRCFRAEADNTTLRERVRELQTKCRAVKHELRLSCQALAEWVDRAERAERERDEHQADARRFLSDYGKAEVRMKELEAERDRLREAIKIAVLEIRNGKYQAALTFLNTVRGVTPEGRL